MWLINGFIKRWQRRKQLDLIRRVGPARINLFAHTACAQGLKQLVVERKEIIAQATEGIQPKSLIGRFPDISHCDVCGREFQQDDESYVCYMAMNADEFELWQQVKRERGEEAG